MKTIYTFIKKYKQELILISIIIIIVIVYLLLRKKYESLLTAIDNYNIYYAVENWLFDKTSAKIQYGDIKDWDVSNVTNMDSLFYGNNGRTIIISANNDNPIISALRRRCRRTP